MNNQLRAPVRLSPSVERLDADEAKTTQGLIATIRYITDKTFADGGHAIRGVHAKSHGILEGYLEVYADLPGDLAQGMFAKPGRYPVVMRLSTIPGDILDDSVSVPRAMAVKIIGVEGERLEGSENDVTQDFVMINGPAFGAPTPKKFLSVLRLLSKTTDRFEWLKKILSAVMRQVQRVIVAVTGKPSATVATLGGQPETHILGETFYSQAPLRFGDFIAKIAVAPISTELIALIQAPLKLDGVPNGLREAVVDFFKKMAVYGRFGRNCAPTLNLCRLRTLRSCGRRKSVLIGRLFGLQSNHRSPGARRDRRLLTMECHFLLGTGSLHIVLSAE